MHVKINFRALIQKIHQGEQTETVKTRQKQGPTKNTGKICYQKTKTQSLIQKHETGTRKQGTYMKNRDIES